ncbi:virulence protein E [Mesorhizobium sp. B2-4-14]|uniref:virulence-associated E family protein n=1 Tax=Mesorhizobium sp. B2-4-14 TaxID=2589935 RepID=UPI00112ABB25|nr:virulence-associated E family protein [Mesorhizobium sp. B2-4-14]TPL00679.1 virulence protein E [Mesorhizobium sp. B2-4-14]
MLEAMKAETFEFEVVGPLTAEDMAALSPEVEAEWEAFEREQEKPTGIGPLVEMFAKNLTRKQQPSAPVPAKTDATSELSRVHNPSGIVPSLDNAERAIRELPAVVFRFDLFRQRVIPDGLDVNLGVTLDELVVHVRRAVIKKFEFDPGDKHAFDAIRILARENAFNPVLDYINAQSWDGEPRIDRWLSVYLGAEDNELNRAFGRTVLIAGVRRVRKPGSKFDYVLVLEGPQGRGKSTALKIMAGGEDFFSDEIAIGVSYKEQQELLQGRWIVELPELAGLRNADIRGVKQFVSKQFDRGRPAFGRSVENLPRRCIFIGTTNDSQYLRDGTGNRRFWPVTVGKIDLKGLAEDMPQLWAEAGAAEPDAPDPLTIPEGLWSVAAERQAERVAGDPWQEILEVGLPKAAERSGDELRIPTRAIFKECLGIEFASATRRDTLRLAECMRALGWEGPKPFRFRGALEKGYVRPVDE